MLIFALSFKDSTIDNESGDGCDKHRIYKFTMQI